MFQVQSNNSVGVTKTISAIISGGSEMYTKIWSEILKRSFGRHRHRWKDNIRIDLREI